MNYSTAILIAKDDCRAVKVTYEATENAPKAMFKTFDKSIKVGDYVVVPTDTRHNLTVCKVMDVDVDDWMDTSSNIPWIVGRVDLADVTKLKEWEDKAITEIKHAEKLKRRREMQASMEAATAENPDVMKLLNSAPSNAEQPEVEHKE